MSDFADASQVIIALVNLILAGYVFLYQMGKDKRTENETARLNEQNIKLQWFKELIVQPNMEVVERFYAQLHTIQGMINSSDLSIDEKQDINNFVKDELSVLRKTFIDVIQLVDKSLSNDLLRNVDELTDSVTEAIFNDELKLNNATVYEKYIGSKIRYSKNNLIASLYNYKGLPG